MRRAAFLIAMTLVAAWWAPASAQTAEQKAQDEKNFAVVKNQVPGKPSGIVILDAVVKGEASNCPETVIGFGRRINNQIKESYAKSLVVGWPRTMFYGVMAAVPGEYFISSVTCRPVYNVTRRLNGPHARFEVRAGEIVNVGTLNLQYTSDGFFSGTGTLQRAVTPLRERVVATIKEQMPQSFARAVYRPMVVVAPTARMKR